MADSRFVILYNIQGTYQAVVTQIYAEWYRRDHPDFKMKILPNDCDAVKCSVTIPIVKTGIAKVML